MNKTQQKLAKYGQAVNDLIDNTEKVQEGMSKYFTPLKAAVADGKLAEMSEQDYQKTAQIFRDGVDQYHEFLAQFKTVVAPARLMGNNRRLIGAYADFIQGCEDLITSMHDDQTVDMQAFAASEMNQDKATERISKYIQNISRIA